MRTPPSLFKHRPFRDPHDCDGSPLSESDVRLLRQYPRQPLDPYSELVSALSWAFVPASGAGSTAPSPVTGTSRTLPAPASAAPCDARMGGYLTATGAPSDALVGSLPCLAFHPGPQTVLHCRHSSAR